MDLKNVLAITLLFSGLCSYSQIDSITNDVYITKFQDRISTRLSLINTSNSFFLYDDEDHIYYDMQPNIRDYVGVSILFRSLELTYGFSPNFLSRNRDNENSKLFNLNFRMFYNQWMQTLDLYDQKGFSVLIDQDIIDFPKIKTLKVGGSTSYIFNKNFSFRAIGFQNEQQLKSAGSFVPRLYYYYTKYSEIEDDINYNAYTYNIAIAPAYYYNLVLKKHFLLSLGGSLGVGLNYSNNLGEGKETSILYQFSGRGALSYNSTTFFCGINSNILFLQHYFDKPSVLHDVIRYLEFYIGYRFKAPKKWIKKADNFNKKYGF